MSLPIPTAFRQILIGRQADEIPIAEYRRLLLKYFAYIAVIDNRVLHPYKKIATSTKWLMLRFQAAT